MLRVIICHEKDFCGNVDGNNFTPNTFTKVQFPYTAGVGSMGGCALPANMGTLA